MKAPSSEVRLAEIKQLLDYGFATYQVQSLCDKDTVVDSKMINKNVNDVVDIVIKDNVTSLLEKGSKIETEQVIKYDEELIAPIMSNSKVGTIEIIDKSTKEIIGTSDLIVKVDIAKSNFMEYFKQLFKMFILRG